MDAYRDILSPLGARAASDSQKPAKRKPLTSKPVIGLLDNSKPNVAEFLQALEGELRSRNASYEFVRLTKPRSAMACPDVDAFATRCDYVINAVAD
jgi:hypothetical protein